MALFAAIGDRFVAKILRQVASDYNLDFEEMKSRYCGKSSFETMVPTKQFQVDLEEPEVPEVPEVSEGSGFVGMAGLGLWLGLGLLDGAQHRGREPPRV
jgi:hypothetical protein